MKTPTALTALLLCCLFLGLACNNRQPAQRDSAASPSAANATVADRGSTAAESSRPAAAKGQVDPIKDGVIVYYFHGTARCEGCIKMDGFTQRAVETAPGGEPRRLQYISINRDLPDYEHFTADYKLAANSVVLVEVKDGRPTARWTNLPQVWDLLEDELAFRSYIHTELAQFTAQS